MELLIVRHAQPERTEAGPGGADPSLSPMGRRQAAALADWLARNPRKLPDRVLSSSMRRAQETASAVADRCQAELEIDPRLTEFDLGAKEYVPLELAGDDVLAHVVTALDTGVWGDHKFDPEEFRQRVQAGFDDILRDSDARRVIVVCHGGVLNSYLSGVVGRPHGVFFMPRYTSVSRVHAGVDGHVRLRSLNELPHASSAANDVTF